LKQLELYGGGGIGSIYYDIDKDPGGGASGWVAAADTFLGVSYTLKNSIVIGVEWKYFFTESVHSLDDGFDSEAVMVTVGFSR
jgi:opacity protein-like surface antigen